MKDFRDIEYGLENPERTYGSVVTADPYKLEFLNRVLALSRAWHSDGRALRDVLICELHGDGKTVREICDALRSKRMKPRSIGAVHKTIQEIETFVLKIEHQHLGVEQRLHALHLLDSKPEKDDANGEEKSARGQTDQSSRGRSRAA